MREMAEAMGFIVLMIAGCAVVRHLTVRQCERKYEEENVRRNVEETLTEIREIKRAISEIKTEIKDKK